MQGDFLGGLDRLLMTTAVVKTAVVLVDDGVHEFSDLILVPFDLEEEHGPPKWKNPHWAGCGVTTHILGVKLGQNVAVVNVS